MTRNPDRLIAVTLLILPLVDVVPEAAAEGSDALAVITDHKSQIYSFLLSFAVIVRFWLTHHRMFEHVRAYNTRLVQLNMIWLLFIVILPFPTEIVGTYPSSRFTAGLYIANIVALGICQLGLTLMTRGHRELEQEDNPVTRREMFGTVTFTVLSLVAFLLAVLVPGITFYALLLLLLAPVFSRLWDLREQRAD